MDLLTEIKESFDLFYSNNAAYRNRVSAVGNLFGLTDKATLRADFLPTYLVGDYARHGKKFVLFGINPGFDEEQNKEEESLKNQTWDKYQDFVKRFYIHFGSRQMKSRYYEQIAKLFEGLDSISLSTSAAKYRYFDQNLIAIELIPYHSTASAMPGNLTSRQREYLVQRFQVSIDFIRSIECRLVILNGKPFYNILSGTGELRQSKVYQITARTKLHAFRYKDVPCILFNYMITQPASGVTDDHLRRIVPGIVNEYFGKM